MKTIEKILKEKKQLIETDMKKYLQKEQHVSATLQEAMEYSLFSGGKRIRPILCLLTADLVAGDITAARRAACALEFIHTYSLIHDDLPVMDDDDFRRGQPSNHKVYGPGIAILAGDGLLTLAFNVLAGLQLPAGKTNKIMAVVSAGAGPDGMVGGQVLDLQGEERQLSLHELQLIHKNKTGALIKSSILAGAYCGDPRSEEVAALEEFALKLGLLFQITDDILDVIGDRETLGKAAGSDDRQNKATYPALLGLQGARKRASQCAQEAKTALDIFGEGASVLRKLVSFVLDRDY